MITVDWEAIEKDYGNLLSLPIICQILGISRNFFHVALEQCLNPVITQSGIEYKIKNVRFASERLGLTAPKEDEKHENTEDDKQSHRFELRKRIYEIMKSRLGKKLAIEKIDEPFDWIYNSPMNEWENMLYCFEQECYIDSKDNKWSDYATRDAKMLYDLLN